jgi:hypothetical protein
MTATDCRQFPRNNLVFLIIRVPCSKTNHHICSKKSAIIRYNKIQTLGNPPTYFYLSGYSIKNTVRDMYIIDVQ